MSHKMMKACAIVSLLWGFLFSFSVPSHAEVERGDHIFRFSGGGEKAGGEFGDIADDGLFLELSYHYHLFRMLSIGANISHSDFYQLNYSLNAKYDVDVNSIGAFLRMDLFPENIWHPYVLAGPSHNQIKAEFGYGQHNNKSTNNQTGGFAGAGFDVQVQDDWFGGFEARYKNLGSARDSWTAMISVSYRIGDY